MPARLTAGVTKAIHLDPVTDRDAIARSARQLPFSVDSPLLVSVLDAVNTASAAHSAHNTSTAQARFRAFATTLLTEMGLPPAHAHFIVDAYLTITLRTFPRTGATPGPAHHDATVHAARAVL